MTSISCRDRACLPLQPRWNLRCMLCSDPKLDCHREKMSCNSFVVQAELSRHAFYFICLLIFRKKKILRVWKLSSSGRELLQRVQAVHKPTSNKRKSSEKFIVTRIGAYQAQNKRVIPFYTNFFLCFKLSRWLRRPQVLRHSASPKV